MNRSSIYATALALAPALCTSDGRARQRSSSTPSTSPPSTTTPTVQSFVQEAATSNQKEIGLSRLAMTRAQNEDVRDFAEELVEDHTEALEKLREYASEKGIMLRTTMTFRTSSKIKCPCFASI